MGKRKNKNRMRGIAVGQPRPSRPALPPPRLFPARALLVLSLVIASYLAWASLKGGSLPGCGPASGCDKVLQSRWAYWIGVPVTIPAVLVYAGLLWATFWIGPGASAAKQRLGWIAVMVLSVAMTGAAFWFAGLQAFVLKSFCKFCMTAHASAVVAAVLLLRRVPLQRAADSAGQSISSVRIPRPAAVKFCIAGMSALAVLAAGQILVEKQQHAVKTVQGLAAYATNLPVTAVLGPAETNAPAAAASRAEAVPAQAADTVTNSAAAPNAPATAQREISLHAGKYRLRVGELPIIGSPTAPHVIVSLFDYTCHYCRDMHGLLLEAQRRFSNQLAIVSLPMPLDASCNRLMQKTPSPHVNACQYAKLGLAVWRSRPEVFGQFDAWIFAPPSPPPVDDAKQFAEQLVGREPLAQALTNDWVRRQIETDVDIYESNSREMRDGRMPQLVIGSAISVGPLERIDPLYLMLAEQWGLKTSP